LLSKDPAVTKVLHLLNRYPIGGVTGKVFAYFTDAYRPHQGGNFWFIQIKRRKKFKGFSPAFGKTLKFLRDM
jgi:hypothetical protein